MRLAFRLAVVAVAVACVAEFAAAEPIGSYLYLSPSVGYTRFDPDQRFPGITELVNGPNVGGRLGWQWNRWLALEGGGDFTGTREDRIGGANVDWLHGSLVALLSPVGTPNFSPYLLVGAGASRFKLAGDGLHDGQGNAEAGLGARMWFNDVMGLRLEARDVMHLPKDDLANIAHHTYVATAAVTFALNGKPRDTDADGIPDRLDKCPNTPAGALADPTGCPLDSDGDGVFDGLDQCSSTPTGARVDARGCPTDADADSVFDGIDQCPNTPRGVRVDAKGCPVDSDGDGVPDGPDQCGNTPAGTTVDANGCPVDSDGDGVSDGQDRCPGTTLGVKVDPSGCPVEVVERETELLDTGMIRLEGVQFETGKALLVEGGQSALDAAGAVLVRWPELKIEIGGHTDARGSNAANQKLSEARVQSVLDYLLAKYPSLLREQFTLKGYGESKPVAPNTSDAGMARNRRVELKVLNRDVLRRTTERRVQQPATPAPADTTRK